MSQDVVDDGNEVGQALAGPRARGQDVRRARGRDAHSILLMLVQAQGLPVRGDVLAPPEDAGTLRMQHAFVDQCRDGCAGSECRVQLDERVRPEVSIGKPLLDEILDLFVSDGEK